MVANSGTKYLTLIGLFCKNWGNCEVYLTVKNLWGIISRDVGDDLSGRIKLWRTNLKKLDKDNESNYSLLSLLMLKLNYRSKHENYKLN